ncbi:hypothetical protein KIN20_000322 [Parelaphostrongylus tenuis]|uniref:Uncharacterized protein n=1 Tax=Parelaphostrongylus tenuis TaxID=148309 RepID=A0AAD5MB21_PARTN|nr:hypothetical protein KIN20_000322 [Parelaphostrongylus tenuis]
MNRQDECLVIICDFAPTSRRIFDLGPRDPTPPHTVFLMQDCERFGPQKHLADPKTTTSDGTPPSLSSLNMVYSTYTSVCMKAFGIAECGNAVRAFVSRLVMQTVTLQTSI